MIDKGKSPPETRDFFLTLFLRNFNRHALAVFPGENSNRKQSVITYEIQKDTSET